MKIRKKLSMCISLIAAAAMMFSFNASALELNESIDTEPQWVEDTVDIYSIIVDSFSETPNYAGAYFKNNVLHISTTNVAASENFLNQIAISSTEAIPEVKFNEVKYTDAELLQARDFYVDNGESWGVIDAYTLPEENTVVVDVTDLSSPAMMARAYAPILDNVVFNAVGESEIVEDATYIRGGYEIDDITQRKAFSFGCMFKWNSTGEYGFLTAAHNSVQVGDVFTYNGTQIGTAASVQNSGSIDATLIKRTNTSYTGSNKNGTAGVVCTQSGSPIVGDTLTLFGKTTGSSTGTITSITLKSSSGLTNLIKSTCISQSGDSGGALIASRSSGNVFVGINLGHDTSDNSEVGVNWTNIKNTYNISRVSSAE